MDYCPLQSGDILQKGDEYSTAKGVWRIVPEFMIGDHIPENTNGTKWRRPEGGAKSKKHWWNK